jgi:hypothetical protein
MGKDGKMILKYKILDLREMVCDGENGWILLRVVTSEGFCICNVEPSVSVTSYLEIFNLKGI